MLRFVNMFMLNEYGTVCDLNLNFSEFLVLNTESIQPQFHGHESPKVTRKMTKHYLS